MTTTGVSDTGAIRPVAGLTKRTTFLALAGPSIVLVLAATRTWVSGRSADPVLGGATLEVAGSQAAPGVVALGAVALAGTVALLTAGPRLRRVSAVFIALAAAGATALTVLVVLDPAGALGTAAAERVGQTGRVGTVAALTFWVWPALVAAVSLTIIGVLVVPASGRWEGLSSRFDRPEAGSGDARGIRRSAWDTLSDGADPTLPPRPGDPAAPESESVPGLESGPGPGPGPGPGDPPSGTDPGELRPPPS